VSIVEPLGVSERRIADFCEKWRIVEFAVFGSALRDDFRPDSDVDVLVTFAPDGTHSLFDLVEMECELSRAFGRKVDLIDRQALANPFRRQEILRTRKVVYAA